LLDHVCQVFADYDGIMLERWLWNCCYGFRVL